MKFLRTAKANHPPLKQILPDDSALYVHLLFWGFCSIFQSIKTQSPLVGRLQLITSGGGATKRFGFGPFWSWVTSVWTQ